MVSSKVISMIAKKVGVKKDVDKEVFEAYAEFVLGNIHYEEKIALPCLGKFKSVYRGEREGRNPNTGEGLHIPARQTMRFDVSTTIKKEVTMEV